MEKGSNKYIPVVSRAVPESWSTSNGTFKTKKVGEVGLSIVEYSASKKVHLHPDVVEYSKGGPLPLYNLIIGKQTLHDIGTVLDFKERTITIDDILLPTSQTPICLTLNISDTWCQSKTIRGTKYYNRYQYFKTYCSYVHLI